MFASTLRWSSVAILCMASVGWAQDAPLAPADAPRHMTLPEGFQATLFAGEPDLVQPLAFTLDDRGRMWVVECLSYPRWITEGRGQDRVVILEDTDADGRFDERKVFWDAGTNLSGIELGFGGVWLCSSPNLVFVPDRNADDAPDGPAEVLLDGWDVTAKHNVFNGLIWGPDGWLYGCNGILSNSRVGHPGSAETERVAINCGVWRYHPTQRVFEAVAHGTTNPWGLDFDDNGQMFITNCVIKHLFHVVPGAHMERMFGQDMLPHGFGLLASCADHIHWAGGYWDTEGVDKPENDSVGGGHAHCGAMVYLGDNWPDEYRNCVYTCNIHGHRVNRDLLEPAGSGYVARHASDLLKANDPWFRGVALQYGPDGAVYVLDWNDTGECHDYEEVHQESGRIYKVTHGQPPKKKVDLASLRDADLVNLLLHKNDWYVRHARRLLAERHANSVLEKGTRESLRRLLPQQADPSRTLRVMWALHVTGGLGKDLLPSLLASPQEYVRGWAIQLAIQESSSRQELLQPLARLAHEDPSPVVRLYLASALQRLDLTDRLTLARELVAHGEDRDDAMLPLMYWYGVEPLVARADDTAFELLSRMQIPLLRQYAGRRLSIGDNLDRVVRALAPLQDDDARLDVLTGVHQALAGRRDLKMPMGWSAISEKLTSHPDPSVRQTALALAVLFGDSRAVATLRELALDRAANIDVRKNALHVLVEQKTSHLVDVLYDLLTDNALRGSALLGLASCDEPEVPARILGVYANLTDEERGDAISTLCARPSYASALLQAMEAGQIERTALSPFGARQLQSLNVPEISERLAKVWGTVRPASEVKTAVVARYKELLVSDYLATADRSRGRAVFTRQCANCHRIFDSGGRIGPELTGSQRGNLDYILENLADPSAVVPRDYLVTVAQTSDGRFITGIVKSEDENVITFQTANDVVVVPKSDIEAREQSKLSMMPEGLLANLKDEDVRDLISYLASPTQVPLPAAPEAGAEK